MAAKIPTIKTETTTAIETILTELKARAIITATTTTTNNNNSSNNHYHSNKSQFQDWVWFCPYPLWLENAWNLTTPNHTSMLKTIHESISKLCNYVIWAKLLATSSTSCYLATDDCYLFVAVNGPKAEEQMASIVAWEKRQFYYEQFEPSTLFAGVSSRLAMVKSLPNWYISFVWGVSTNWSFHNRYSLIRIRSCGCTDLPNRFPLLSQNFVPIFHRFSSISGSTYPPWITYY